MVLYGVAALALCVISGMIIGDLLGLAVGVDANVGGVGFAMIMLVLLTDWLRKRDLFPKATEQGVLFWSALYIPIVVAMASTQNVVEAVAGGPMAIIAGVTALVLGAAMVPAISRIGGKSDPLPPMTEEEKQEA